jgi:hypothetical protein
LLESLKTNIDNEQKVLNENKKKLIFKFEWMNYIS